VPFDRAAFDRLESFLACPCCKRRLELVADVIRCPACAFECVQRRTDSIDLMPPGAEDTGWRIRQEQMEIYYRGLARDSAEASLAFRSDYDPFAPLLAGFKGRVLDVGGGNGIVRHYLRGVDYVALDPSLDWLEPAWQVLAPEFPCVSEPLPFVHGVGEYLPFAAGAFDGALAFWSLNHARSPGAVLSEVARVLRPDAPFLVVLEDMRPNLADAVRRVSGAGGFAVFQAAVAVIRDWTKRLEKDHIRIRENVFRRWTGAVLSVDDRRWMGPYLCFSLRRQAGEDA
jgi:SAM-dependent methyltransferase